MNDSSRRDFVLAGAATIGASERSLAADREIRIASIGVGNRGTSLMKQSLQQIMGREAIYRQRSVMWKELGVTV
jgi:hypothetical protein